MGTDTGTVRGAGQRRRAVRSRLRAPPPPPPGRRSCGLGWAERAAASPPPRPPAAPRRQRPASRPAPRPRPARRCGSAAGPLAVAPRHWPPHPGLELERATRTKGWGVRPPQRGGRGSPVGPAPGWGRPRNPASLAGAPHPPPGMKSPLRVSWPIPNLSWRCPCSESPALNCPGPPLLGWPSPWRRQVGVGRDSAAPLISSRALCPPAHHCPGRCCVKPELIPAPARDRPASASWKPVSCRRFQPPRASGSH